MKDYTENNPVFSDKITILDPTDTDHADNFNVPLKQLADNSQYLKRAVDDTKDSTTTFVHSRTRENIKSGEKHSTIFGKIARYLQDLKLVAFTGKYDDLSGKPQAMAPTAHTHTKSQISDFAHTHTKNQISDFPASMPASDVKAWAKAANKPSYSWSEIGNKPQTFPPSSHNHNYAASSHTHAKSDITDFPQSMPASDVYSWAKAANKPSYSWSEIGSKPQTFPPSSHTHDYAASNHSHSSYATAADPLFNGTISLNTYAKIASVYSNQITLYTSMGGCTNEDGISVSSNTDGTTGIYGADNRCTCGGSNVRWKEIFAVSPVISTSDKREKYDISYIGSDSSYDTAMTDDMLVKLMMGFAPVVFKRTNGYSGRPHHGIISQDFEALMKEIGLADHAAFIKSPVTELVKKETEDKDGNIHLELMEEVVPGEYRYGMRYEELITDTIRFCQILYRKNEALEKTVQEYKEKTEKLEKRIEALEKIINQRA